MTFDLAGLDPGRPADLPECIHSFGLDANFDVKSCTAVTLTPGPHLASGAAMFPVVRSLAWLSAVLAAIPNIEAVCWHYARSCSAPDYFRTSVLRWIDGGAFPGLGLAALIESDDGALQSEGLALFTGQELHLDADIASDRTENAKIALRLLHWLVEHGTVREQQSLAGPSGEPLMLNPEPSLGLVKVLRA